jgi:hypothetical protein
MANCWTKILPLQSSLHINFTHFYFIYLFIFFFLAQLFSLDCMTLKMEEIFASKILVALYQPRHHNNSEYLFIVPLSEPQIL